MAELMKNLAGLHDSWVDNRIKDVESVATGLNQTIVAEKCEMLGEICLCEASYLEKLIHARFPLFEYVKHLQTLWISQYLVYVGILVICLLGQR